MANEIYVGVGCVEAQLLPFAVLKYSIAKRTSRSVRVEPLCHSGIEVRVPRDPKNRQKTPFSFQRFIVPEVRKYRGRAIYLDSDMLVFGDIGTLLEHDFGESNLLAVSRETSVLVLDCEKLSWRISDLVDDLDGGRLSYDALMSCRKIAEISYVLPPTWNWLDNSNRALPKDVALVHYTVTSSQPWVSAGNAFAHLWLKELFAAIDDDAVGRDEVKNAIDQGFVRPSLLYQIDHRVTEKADLPAPVVASDQPFADYCRSVRYVIEKGFQHH